MGFMRSTLWWRPFARCLALAVISALLALGFVGLVDRGTEWLSSKDQSNDAFSGSPWILVTLVAAGFLIGLIHKWDGNLGRGAPGLERRGTHGRRGVVGGQRVGRVVHLAVRGIAD